MSEQSASVRSAFSPALSVDFMRAGLVEGVPLRDLLLVEATRWRDLANEASQRMAICARDLAATLASESAGEPGHRSAAALELTEQLAWCEALQIQYTLSGYRTARRAMEAQLAEVDGRLKLLRSLLASDTPPVQLIMEVVTLRTAIQGQLAYLDAADEALLDMEISPRAMTILGTLI